MLAAVATGLVAPLTAEEPAAPPPPNVAVLGGPLGVPLPLFPPDNWWNQDISAAPVDPNSAAFISFVGTSDMHPDFGGVNEDAPAEVYGMPVIVVEGDQPKKAVIFDYADESDGVDHDNGDTPFPFYPIPDQVITQNHWMECGPPGSVDLRDDCDRHILMVDKTNNHLYEIYNAWYDTAGSQWYAGSGAFFDMDTNGRRPEGWTSADAAGLAVVPGLVRYDEVYESANPIRHAFRVTVRATNGHVYPASHTACFAPCNPAALPMGARLRLKASVNISGYPAPVQKIFQAMKTYGLIVADNGSDMYVSGMFDTRWDNGVLNPAFHSLNASDFEVIELGWKPVDPTISFTTASSVVNEETTSNAVLTVRLTTAAGEPTTTTAPATVNFTLTALTATAGADFNGSPGTVTFPAGTATNTTKTISIPIVNDALSENSESFRVNLIPGAGGTPGTQATHTVTITSADPSPAVSVADVSVAEGGVGGSATLPFAVTLSAPSGRATLVNYTTEAVSATAGSDFTPRTGTLNIPAGQVNMPLPVSVVGDAVDERHEGMLFRITYAQNLVPGRMEAQGVIRDDDGGASPCEPVLLAPLTIAAPGAYCLHRDLYGSITVSADNVRLDLGGFLLQGPTVAPGTSSGVYVNDRRNVTVRNGKVLGFFRGVYLRDTGLGGGHLVEDLTVTQSASAGIQAHGKDLTLRRNRVLAIGAGLPGAVGLRVTGPRSRVLDNDVSGVGDGTGAGVLLSASPGSFVSGNRLGGSDLELGFGLRIMSSPGVSASGNRILGATTGISYEGSSTGTYSGNTTVGVDVPYSGGTNGGGNQ
jgi:hypothetical protein